MARIFHDSVLVDASELQAVCTRILAAQGVPPADAEYVAWHLVETNLRGTDSHGVARLPHYVRRLRAGGILATPEIRFERRAAALGLVDGGHGLGHLVMRRAAVEAIELAESSGAGWVAVRNSSHAGAMAPFALQIAARGMIGFAFTHVDPMVLPHGSRAPFCGTNPICVAAPGADGRTLCLDMATSVVPWNLVANAQLENVPIPSGWAVDEAGNDTTDAAQVRALYAVGQHKGSGLGIMIDVLCALLGGAPYGPDIPRMYGPNPSEHRHLGGLVGAIRIDAFVPGAEFEQRVSELVSRLCGLPPAQGFERVYYPGQPEVETRQQRVREGIPVGTHTLEELNALAAEAGVEPLRPKPAITP